jgi:hypothetical protein
MSYPNWVHPFLVNLERTGNVSGSARLAGLSGAATAYNLRKVDADFLAAWDLAIEAHTDDCEQELTRRAFGYEDPVVYQGQLTPVWERDEFGNLVMDRVECDPYLVGDTTVTHKLVPRQARDANGQLRWLTVTKFSDTLLLARMKAYRKRYATDRTEVVSSTAVDSMTDAELLAEFNTLQRKLAAIPKAEPADDDLSAFA